MLTGANTRVDLPVTQNDASMGFVSLDQINQQMAVLNSFYSPYGFNFSLQWTVSHSLNRR
jgi:hypothetical protein